MYAFTVLNQFISIYLDFIGLDLRALNDSSIGLRSGEYGGRYKMRQPERNVREVTTLREKSLTGSVYKLNDRIIVMDPAIVKYENGPLGGVRVHLWELLH